MDLRVLTYRHADFRAVRKKIGISVQSPTCLLIQAIMTLRDSRTLAARRPCTWKNAFAIDHVSEKCSIYSSNSIPPMRCLVKYLAGAKISFPKSWKSEGSKYLTTSVQPIRYSRQYDSNCQHTCLDALKDFFTIQGIGTAVKMLLDGAQPYAPSIERIEQRFPVAAKSVPGRAGGCPSFRSWQQLDPNSNAEAVGDHEPFVLPRRVMSQGFLVAFDPSTAHSVTDLHAEGPWVSVGRGQRLQFCLCIGAAVGCGWLLTEQPQPSLRLAVMTLARETGGDDMYK
ncbi:hypothetical protein KC323_g11 [Hortaea werneckii]|nr:hypothetical protein KC323_g11 [Hortaea werneckii]